MGVKFGVLCQENNMSYVKRGIEIGELREQCDEENIWCEREVGIEGCRRFCSELHVCYGSQGISNIIMGKKMKNM